MELWNWAGEVWSLPLKMSLLREGPATDVVFVGSSKMELLPPSVLGAYNTAFFDPNGFASWGPTLRFRGRKLLGILRSTVAEISCFIDGNNLCLMICCCDAYWFITPRI